MERYFETKRLYFRRFTYKDSGRVAYLCNDRDLVDNLLYLPYPYTEAHAREWISYHNENFIKERLYEFAIILKEDDRIIGCISLSNDKMNLKGDVGYWIGRDYWGQGYATEALEGLIKYAFEERGFHKICSEHFIYNPASGRVMQKASMDFEGIRKDHIFKNGSFHTVVTYGIINRSDGLKNILKEENNLNA